MRCAVDGCSPCTARSASGRAAPDAATGRRAASSSARSPGSEFFASSRGVAAISHCKMRRHARGNLHRRPARDGEEAGRAGDLRVRRLRLVHRVHAARQPRRQSKASGCGSASASTWTGRSTKTKMLGREVTMPLALAPVGLLGLNWANGEILAARRQWLRRAFHALDDVDLLDRGRRRRHGPAVLVPALRDARIEASRLRSSSGRRRPNARRSC